MNAISEEHMNLLGFRGKHWTINGERDDENEKNEAVVLLLISY